MTLARRLDELAAEHDLDDQACERLARLLELVAREPASITSVRDPATAVDVHVADSLVAVPVLRGVASVADLGSGGGFPGLVIAIALPGVKVTLVESVRRKVRFLNAALEDLELLNAEVAAGRAEQLAPERFHVVTARAVASLPVLLEYAAPILVDDGLLLAWKGRRDEQEARDGAAAAAHLEMSDPAWRRVRPYADVERHLVASRKIGPTPPGFPRRPGLARKRPLGA